MTPKHTIFSIIAMLTFLCFDAFSQTSNNMSLCSNYDGGDTYNDIWGYVDDNGREYAILGSTGKISIIDVTDPYNTVLINEFSPGMTSTWRDMKSYGNYVYGCSEAYGEGLTIIDMSNLPTSANLVTVSNSYWQSSHNIYIDEVHGRLYTAGAKNLNGHVNMMVFDLTANPADPTLMANVNLVNGGYVHDVYVRDHIAYCSHGYNGYAVYDLTDPNNPIPMSSIATSGYNHSSWVTADGVHTFVAEEVPRGMPLLVMDLTNVASNDIEVVHDFKDPLLGPTHMDNTPHNPFIVGDYLYLSYYEDGIVVFDIRDPLNPVRVAHYDTSNNTDYNGYYNVWGCYPFLPSGKILGSDRSTGLYVLEANIPVCPVNFSGANALSGMSNAVADYETNGVIESTQVLSLPAKVDYDSKQYIDLLPGFEVIFKAEFSAFIDGCNGGSGGLNNTNPIIPTNQTIDLHKTQID